MSKVSTSDDIKIIDIVLDMNERDLQRGLEYLLDIQSVTSAINPDCIPAVDELPTKDQLRTYFLAMMVETGELLQELNWKPWKKDKTIDKARVVDEFADILAFLGILITYLNRLGMSTDDLAAAYVSKTRVNINRFLGKVEGYGVTVSQSSDEVAVSETANVK